MFQNSSSASSAFPRGDNCIFTADTLTDIHNTTLNIQQDLRHGYCMETTLKYHLHSIISRAVKHEHIVCTRQQEELRREVHEEKSKYSVSTQALRKALN
jgi:rRNA-processing protein FCF1